MKLSGRGFWVGLVLGVVSAGAAGLYAVNLQARIGYIDQTLNGANRLDHLNELRARLEAGDVEAADRFHRSVAWANLREASYYECMGNSSWVVQPKLESACAEALHKAVQVPEDFEIPGLNQAREKFASNQVVR